MHDEIGRDGSSRRTDFRRGEVVATHRAEGRDDVADGKNGVPPGHDRARQRLAYLRRMFDRVRFRVRRKLTEHGKANFSENEGIAQTNRSRSDIRKELMTQALTFIARLLRVFFHVTICRLLRRRLPDVRAVAIAQEITRVTREDEQRNDADDKTEAEKFQEVNQVKARAHSVKWKRAAQAASSEG